MNEDRIPVLGQSDERSSKRKHSKKIKKNRSMKRTAQPFEPALNDEETEDMLTLSKLFKIIPQR